ncbi:uncharacterized protein LAESUDRAFT_700637 [Laetiporus sulphureus 93-53]|uniref:Nudix hydrolase domain-containing protein n=1 Tax=Laetiporus sulphureus 93-53 TaxID=1314785 RepID=A0A165E5N8_9APHY|nr:uncharacterized protein LAESUDRAFT_700637 [Laetiporus sulphureus 93-53]KZT06285.1 hypothetical protein LAESUDRAFT_700637 [Laetiporus sulphureus 93-53]
MVCRRRRRRRARLIFVAEPSIVPLLSRALHHIRSTPPRVIASPATQPRRAAVALIIRVSPPPSYTINPQNTGSQPGSPALAPASSLTEFFQLDWINALGAQPEILFLRRDRPELSADAGRMSGSGPRTREAHVAFPGGKTEEGDEGGMYTAMRQTWEEIGLDLAESAYTPIGQLDDREVTTSLGKRLLMILSPFVFLQLTPYTTPVDPAPGTTLHWVPLTELLPYPLSSGAHRRTKSKHPRWSHVTVDASSRLAPRHSAMLRLLMRLLIGSMQFPAIIISPSSSAASADLAYSSESEKERKAIDAKRAHVENGFAGTLGGVLRRQPSLNKLRRRSNTDEELKLWGLSLGMTLDLLAHMAVPASAIPSVPRIEKADSEKAKGKMVEKEEEDGPVVNASALLPPDAELLEMLRIPVVAPSLTSVFPRFSYPDVNFWIWVFGKRYRAVMRGWEASVRAGGTNDRRINWTGSALTTFYAAVRKALVVVLVLRAIGVLIGILVGAWVLFW